jgi:hypothetical protein
MKPAEDTLLTVTKAWIAENAKRGSTTTTTLRVRNINGPNGLAPDQRPHQVTSLSAAFTARVP